MTVHKQIKLYGLLCFCIGALIGYLAMSSLHIFVLVLLASIAGLWIDYAARTFEL